MTFEVESDVAALPTVPSVNQESENGSLHSENDYRLTEGIAAARNGDRPLARTLLFEVTEECPSNAEAWLWLASISEHPEELLGFLNNVLAVEPENERALQWKAATGSLLSKTFVQRGITALDEGDNDFAEECFNSAITNNPNSESAWFWKSSTAKDDVEGLECLERVLKLNPTHSEAQTALSAITQRQTEHKFLDAQVAAAAGDWETAEPIVAEILKTDPGHLNAWTLRSHFSTSVEGRMTAFERILELDEGNSWAQSGKDFLTATLNAVRERISVVCKPADARGTDVAASPHYPGEEGDGSPELLQLSEEVAASDISGEAVIDLAGDEPNSAADSAVEFVEFSESAETLSDTNSEKLANAGKKKGKKAKSETQVKAETVSTETEGEIIDHEPISNRLAAEFAAQETDERIHEFLTEEAVSLPAGFDLRSNAEESNVVDLGPAADLESGAQDDEEALETRSSADDQFAPLEFAEMDNNGDGDPQLREPQVNTGPTAVETQTEDSHSMFAVQDEEAENIDNDVSAIFAESNATFDQPSLNTVPCPYCSAENDAQAFQCDGCRSVLSLSDIDSLLAARDSDRDTIVHAVTQMEAEWNLREFDEVELTTLALGHFNLNDPERGLAYLQEASRLNPNDVILAGQVNALAIRLGEVRRKNVIHDSMPRGKTILVVDDSATVRKLISSKLEKCGHYVVAATDGVEAIELLEDLVPDLVLLDIAMPRMDGYSVCKLIRANEAVKDVPVVMISGKDGFFDKVRGRMAGTSGYVTKPFGPETLMRALETYLVSDTGSVSVE